MPIIEKDPWREQYFLDVPCPSDVVIPTDDEYGYQLFPKHHWVYNKLRVSETQGLDCAPHDILPPHFPVFSKPIYNLRGMGSGGVIIHDAEEYERLQQPGHMWMALLEGAHVSSDAAVVNGEVMWWRHTIGRALEGGMFDYWTIQAEANPTVEQYCAAWVRQHLGDYTGCLNFETIGGRIIELHLRFADQWPDLYGAGWLAAMVRLYAEGVWDYADHDRRTGYSVVLFGGHGPHYRRPEAAVIAEALAMPGVSSVQVTFHEDKPPEWHAMPPGGFRLAVINSWNLDAGLAAREKLALSFWSTQRLRRRPKKARKP